MLNVIRMPLLTGQILRSRKYHRMLCYAMHALGRDRSPGEPPTCEAQMKALTSILEILCQYLSVEELVRVGLASKRTNDIVAAEHGLRCKDFSRGQERAAIKVIW